MSNLASFFEKKFYNYTNSIHLRGEKNETRQIKTNAFQCYEKVHKGTIDKGYHCRYHCGNYRITIIHCISPCLRCESGTGYLHSNCGRLFNFLLRRKPGSDCWPHSRICNYCCGNRCQKRNGRINHGNHYCRRSSDSHGCIPCWCINQIHSLYHCYGIYCGNCRDNFNRSVKGFLRTDLWKRNQTGRNHGKNAMCHPIFFHSQYMGSRCWRNMSRHFDCMAIYKQNHSRFPDCGYRRHFDCKAG